MTGRLEVLRQFWRQVDSHPTFFLMLIVLTAHPFHASNSPCVRRTVDFTSWRSVLALHALRNPDFLGVPWPLPPEQHHHNPTAKLFHTVDPESTPHEMLKALYGSPERYATVVDVEKHANTLPKPLSTQEYQRIHVWGPVLKEDGKCVGAIGKAGSFCLNILSLLPSSLMDRVKAVVPEAMKPMPGDTASSLMIHSLSQ